MNRPESLRVFIDARGVDVRPGATAIEAVEAFDPAVATAVRAGAKILTDSRGLPIDSGSALESGAILRLVSRRDRSAAPNAE
ncbi:MAG TPA: hypothetical protein VFO55_08060 [Gemmatimonadaceae bacterium]|nr:hypothetical protein [Gemmatimonadaceae bacterium]